MRDGRSVIVDLVDGALAGLAATWRMAQVTSARDARADAAGALQPAA